jgi:FGGY-family pentulose kinase
MSCFIGIDVGTGSARAGIFDESGNLLANCVESISTWNPDPDFVEQSSDNIWASICKCTQSILKETGIHGTEVAGLGFDATCSLVLVDANGQPVGVNKEGDDARNIIVWMDHRALAETDEVNNAGDSPVYDFVGGKISPEMQTPKLLWLKKHLPDSWNRAAHFFDLPDYLTYRATGSLTRSLCSLTCKWTYLAHEQHAGEIGWRRDFFEAAGLGDLAEESYVRIGTTVRPMGESIGNGLTKEAANQLGLRQGTPVGVSIIDAHAGGVGMIGLSIADEAVDLDKRLALIGGTSSCHMVVSKEKRFIPGVWGPYYSSMIPLMWLNEGGQSATGALIDHIMVNHGAYEKAGLAAAESEISVFTYLNKHLRSLTDEANIDYLTRQLHVCPDFHGNRSPRADPYLTGMISGLKLSAEVTDLALLYLAAIQGIAYGTRHIIEEMNAKGYSIDTLVCCGGGTKNAVFLQQHANITGCRLVLPEEKESVLLGSAMLGAVAAGHYKDLQHAMNSMSRQGSIIEPKPETAAFHSRKYSVFHRLHRNQLQYKSLMETEL